MGINVLKTINQIDTRGTLTKLILAPNTVTPVYTPDKNVIIALIEISIINAGTVDSVVDIWVGDKNHLNPSTVDLIESKLNFSPNATYMRTDLLIDKNETIFIRCNSSSVVVRITGMEDRTP